MRRTTTLVFLPDGTGVPWDLDKLTHLSDRSRRSVPLPDLGESIEAYADFVEMKTIDLDHFVLVADGFGAAVAIALALRQPERLKGLVLTGGLTASPATDNEIQWLIRAARLIPTLFYKSWFLPRIARSLVSPYDYFGETPWSDEMVRRLYEVNTSRGGVLHRLRALISAYDEESLSEVKVPTLVVAPQHDPLFGNRGAHVLLQNIPHAEGGILKHTGPMLRYTHPTAISKLVRNFLVRRVDPIRDEEIERWYAQNSVHVGLVGSSRFARLSAAIDNDVPRSPSRVWVAYPDADDGARQTVAAYQ